MGHVYNFSNLFVNLLLFSPHILLFVNIMTVVTRNPGNALGFCKYLSLKMERSKISKILKSRCILWRFGNAKEVYLWKPKRYS